MDILTRKQLCWEYDHSDVTIAQIAKRYGITAAEAKKILMDDAWGSSK